MVISRVNSSCHNRLNLKFDAIFLQSSQHLGCYALPPSFLGGWTGRDR